MLENVEIPIGKAYILDKSRAGFIAWPPPLGLWPFPSVCELDNSFEFIAIFIYVLEPQATMSRRV